MSWELVVSGVHVCHREERVYGGRPFCSVLVGDSSASQSRKVFAEVAVLSDRDAEALREGRLRAWVVGAPREYVDEDMVASDHRSLVLLPPGEEPPPGAQEEALWETKVRVVHDTSGSFGAGDVSDRPCPTVTVGGVQRNACHFQVERFMSQRPEQHRKSPLDVPGRPPYRVPTMERVARIPRNGYTAASLFSGCGGSSLGYRLAGFDVRYASEFIPAARDTYAANFPSTHLDGRDVRSVLPGEVLRAVGLREGELDVLDGSPPCASFSTSGKREDGWGSVKPYSDSHQRTDDLFHEYARLVAGVRPRVFVAENVSGLVIGAARGMFLEFLSALKGCGYRVEARLLDAQWLGVPQMRRRLIFVGVREDLRLPDGSPAMPAHPRPLPYRYAVRDAIPWVRAMKSNSGGVPTWVPGDRPSVTIKSGVGQGGPTGNMVTGVVIAGASSETFPDDVTDPHGPLPLPEEDLDAVSIAKYAIGLAWDETAPGRNSERFFNLAKPDVDLPCPTVTATAGSMSAAGVCHPLQKRKFTIGELRRICGFPDDFILTGSYDQQWERLGRAVPPVMMAHVAATVRDEILRPVDGLPPLRPRR